MFCFDTDADATTIRPAPVVESHPLARRLGARLDMRGPGGSLALRRAVLARARRDGAAVVYWSDEQGAPCAVFLPLDVAWRVRDGLVANGTRAGIAFSA